MKMLKYTFLVLLTLLVGTSVGFCQDKTEKESSEEYEGQVRQMISFLQFSLNVLGDPSYSVKDKDVIINESYLKIFKDNNVQIEDDLDEHRDVVTNKSVQAYLKDVDFFFKQVKFELNIVDLTSDINHEGQLFFIVKLMRNLKGITIDNDSIDSDQERFIEVNVDEENKDIKIASIYTTKLSRNEELTYWWAGLNEEWKTLLGVEIEIKEGLRLNEVSEFSDTTYIVDDQQYTDSIKIIDFVKIAAAKEEINLSGSTIITDLKPLDQLKTLRKLDISSSDITDLFPIRNLTTLEFLDCSNTKVENLDPLKYSKSLRELYINNTPISSIMVIENFEKLEIFHLEQTVINSLPTVDNLKNLRELNCASTNLVSLDSIEFLKSLECLNFSNTSVIDLDPISDLNNLKTLIFTQTKVNDLTPVEGLENLQEINFNDTEVDNLMALKNLENLKYIYADNTNIELADFIELSEVKQDVGIIFMSEELLDYWDNMDASWKDVINKKLQLTDSISKEQLHDILKIRLIDIHGNEDISDLEPLKFMPLLKSLNFSETSISDLSPLQSSISLLILKGMKSQVIDISPIKDLANLQVINFDSTGIEDISPLQEMHNIDTLVFNNTQVKNITTLNQIGKFRVAYFEHTPVTDDDFLGLNFEEDSSIVVYKSDKLRTWWGNLDDEWQNIFKESNNLPRRPTTEQLHKLTSKTSLDIRNILLDNLDPIPEFVRLKSLTFKDSRISSLYPLVSLNKIEELHCPRNPISDIEAISNLKQLRVLDLDNTQISGLKPLRSLIELRELKFSGTNVKDLSPVTELKNLEVLEFSKTKIKQIKALVGLQNLKVLKCYNNKISPKKVEEFKLANPDCDVVFY